MGDMGDDFKAFNEMKKKERLVKESGRFNFAEREFDARNITYTMGPDKIMIDYKGGKIQFWSFTGYFCGLKPHGKIKGRGIHKLLQYF